MTEVKKSIEGEAATRVLLIEDDAKLASKLKRFLQIHHYEVTWIASGSFVSLEVNLNAYQFIICDVNLPDISGFDVVSRIRSSFNGVFIFITALTEESAQLKGLELGSDDYIVKPFSAEVLLARMKAASRRGFKSRQKDEKHAAQQAQPINVEGLHISPKNRVVEINGQALKLTKKEFFILYILAQDMEGKVSRNTIYRAVWGKEYDGFDRTIDVHVSALRRKFNNIEGNPYQINSVWGEGYILLKL
ncbi:response regulator transcription factor [Thalassotalea sp. LPB0316]|uniref:response regulator transcription factor n=1 Tax=Thalassotalea sp. LPB0316 TaxID=2769490 RepID=UPI001868CEEA|nr:response regulator transcription factor [Thalassotalea sp. LPB0316]QOL26124.1 response regulator transcription factor [Thalassotalea sp. LPB0316]